MRKNLILLFSLLVSACAVAQPVTTTAPDGYYGKGGTRTTTVTNDGLGTETTTDEWRDGSKPPVLRYREVSIKNLFTGDSTVHGTEYFPGHGEKKEIVTITVFRSGRVSSRLTTVYDKKGDITREEREELLPSGKFKLERFNPKTGIWEEIAITDNSSRNSAKQSCQPLLNIFGGYSYLSGDFGNNNRESFPAGGHISFLYIVSQHIAVGLDASIHTSKNGNWNYTRSFIMADGQYVFGNVNNCDRKIFPDVHVLAGLGSERTKYNFNNNSNSNSSTTLAVGAGLGLNLNVNKKWAVRLFQADYILTRFNDESQHNFRISTGLVLKLGSQ